MGTEFQEKVEDEPNQEKNLSDVSVEDEATPEEEAITTWEQEKEELVNQILRLRADFANYKRRNEELIANIRVNANESLVNELLPVIDHFDLALNSTPEETAFVTGVRMIFQQLLSCLEKEGLQAIEAVGKPFDPNLHEAVSVEGDSNSDLIVTAELKKGYLFKGKLLRESMVQVGPDQQEEEKK